MIPLERQRRIAEKVLDEGQISIAQIIDLFGVSEITARRDLNELDRQGLLRRVHGGAIASLGRSYEPHFQTRTAKNKTEKIIIGIKAAEQVFDGDSIALDVGTTTLEIVRGLIDKRNLTIVTSSIQIANEVIATLSLDTNVRLILAGGVVRARELSMVGMIAERTVRELHVDKAFIGIGGISLRDGLTEYNMEDARMKQVLIESAQEKFVVADSGKFGRTTFTTVGPITSVDAIITDGNAPMDQVEKITSMGVRVIVAG